MRYKDINDLISSDTSAKSYFDSLSDDVRSKLLERGEGINTFDELKRFSESMRRND